MILKLNIILISAVAAWMDLKTWKVKNTWLLLQFIAGILFLVFSRESTGLTEGIVGLIIPFLLLFPLYLMGVMGAGDVKLFSVIGFWIGYRKIIMFMLIAFMSAVFYLLVLLIKKKPVQEILKTRIHVAICSLVSAMIFSGGFY